MVAVAILDLHTIGFRLGLLGEYQSPCGPFVFSISSIFMEPSIVDIEKKRGRGRPQTNATPVLVRLQPAELASLDAWASAQPDPMSRPEAIRRLVEKALETPDDR